MLNKCLFIGRFTADPETRMIPSGSEVSNFTIAVSEKYKDKQGNKKEDTQFIRCNAWDRLSSIISQFCTKGSLVYIEGKWKTRSYDKNNEKRYVTELQVFQLQMLGSKSDKQQSSQEQRGQQNQGYQQGYQDHQVPGGYNPNHDGPTGAGQDDYLEDDIPY